MEVMKFLKFFFYNTYASDLWEMREKVSQLKVLS